METQVLVYRSPVRWAGHALLAAVSVLSLFPLVWMVLNAFKPTDEILYFSLLPQNVTLQNFADALAMIPLPTMIVSSFACKLRHCPGSNKHSNTEFCTRWP